MVLASSLFFNASGRIVSNLSVSAKIASIDGIESLESSGELSIRIRSFHDGKVTLAAFCALFDSVSKGAEVAAMCVDESRLLLNIDEFSLLELVSVSF